MYPKLSVRFIFTFSNVDDRPHRACERFGFLSHFPFLLVANMSEISIDLSTVGLLTHVQSRSIYKST